MDSKASRKTNGHEDEGAKKKRGAEKEMRKEDVESDDEDGNETGTGEGWAKANDEILAKRKIVKVKRSGTVPEVKPEPPKTEEKKSEGTTPTFNFNFGTDTNTGSGFTFNTPFTAFSFATSFSFNTSLFTSSATTPSSSSPTSTTNNGIFGLNIAPPTTTSFAPPFESSEEGESDPSAHSPKIEKNELSNLPNQAIPTGEEAEETVFQTKSKLYVLDTKENKWIERGLGQLKLNVNKESKQSRLIMRVEASLRLILNVPLFASMKVDRAGDKAVRFTGPSMDDASQILIYSVRVSSSDLVDQLIKAVDQYKSQKSGTPAKSTTTTSTTSTEKKTPTKTESHDKNGATESKEKSS